MINQKSGYYHRLIFKSVVLFTQITSCVAYVHALIAPYQKFFLVWGALLIALEAVRGYRPWKQPATLLFGAFLLGYLVTIAFAGEAYLTSNLHAFCYMVMMFLLLFAVDSGDQKQRARENAVLAHIVILTILVITVTGLVIAVVTTRKSSFYKTEIGEFGRLGFSSKRLCGLVNANVGGALYAVGIILPMVMLFRKGRLRALRNTCYGLVILIESIALLLSYSRTAIYAVIAVLAVVIFWQLPLRSKRVGESTNPVRSVIRIGAALAAAAALMLSAGPVRGFLYERTMALRKWYQALSVSEVQVASAGDDGALFAGKKEKETTEAGTTAAEEDPGEEGLDDVLSSRLTIWKTAGKEFLKHPVFGISHEAIEDRLTENSPYHVWHTHSTYITVLLASGLVGAACLTAFTAYGVRGLWRRRNFLAVCKDPSVIGSSMLVLFFLVRELAESTLLFRFNAFACLMWAALGCLRQELESAVPEEMLRAEGGKETRLDRLTARWSEKQSRITAKIGNWQGAGFSSAYLIMTALASVGYFSRLPFIQVLSVIVIVWGAFRAYFGIPEVIKRGGKKELILFCSFLLSFAVSAFVNRAYGIGGNLKTMIWMMMCLFAAFPSGILELRSAEKTGRDHCRIFVAVLMIFTTVMALIGLIMWLAGYGAVIDKDTLHGFVWGRLWGAYVDPNYGSLLSAASVCIALVYLLQGREKHPHPWIYVVHIIILECYIVGAYSRATQLIMMVTTGLFYLYVLLYTKRTARQKIVIAVLLAVLLAMPWAIRTGYNALVEQHNREVEEQIQEAIDAGLDPEQMDIPAPMEELERDSMLEERSFSIRYGIWKDGITLFSTSPLFGVSYRNIMAYAKANDIGRYVNRAINTMHNVGMDVLVSQGILGLILFAATAGLIAVRMIHGWLVFTPEEREEALLLTLPILTVLAGAMTVTDIFYINTPTAVVFWVMLGRYMALYYLRAVPRLREKKNKKV